MKERMKVRNLSGNPLSRSKREFILHQAEHYLGMKNDHPIFVTGYVSDGFYELEATSPVREGYSTSEIITELNRERDFPGYREKNWFVCQLSRSFKTILVLSIHHEG